MLQPNCEPLLPIIEQLTTEIRAIDDRIDTFVAKGMGQLNPLHYLALQPEVDHLVQERRLLQGKWNLAMDELALCQSQSSFIESVGYNHP